MRKKYYHHKTLQEYAELKRKELELQERELKLREKQLNQSQQSGSTENYELDNEREDIRNEVNNRLTAWQNEEISPGDHQSTGSVIVYRVNHPLSMINL